jgi:hypothetical protein
MMKRNAVKRAARWVARMPEAGECTRYQVAYAMMLKLTERFNLSAREVVSVCREWGARCTPPLRVEDLQETARIARL